MIFLSLRFYVKSILRILELQNLPLEALNFDFYEFLHFLKAEIYQFNKIQSPFIGQNGSFCISTILKIDFKQNLSDRKVMKFPHCVRATSIQLKVHFPFSDQIPFYQFEFHSILVNFILFWMDSKVRSFFTFLDFRRCWVSIQKEKKRSDPICKWDDKGRK